MKVSTKQVQSQTVFRFNIEIVLTSFDGDTDGPFEGDIEGSLLGLRDGDWLGFDVGLDCVFYV